MSRRSLHLALGYSSLYVYARERLGLSKHEAYLRIHAARAALRHPEILEGRRTGELSLSAVKLVAPHLDAHPELLDEAKGKSKRQVERAVAEKIGSSVRAECKARPLPGGKVERAVPGPRQCGFVGKGGHVCGETRLLELDQIVPTAQGGSDHPTNRRWLCRIHNVYESQRVLGPDRVLQACASRVWFRGRRQRSRRPRAWPVVAGGTEMSLTHRGASTQP